MNEREVAYKLLVKIYAEKQFSNLALKKEKQNTPFVTQLVYGTLRNYRLVRHCWSKYATNLPNIQIAVLLDMACYELLLMNSEAFATTNEIVQISKKVKGGSYVNFVNAILRKVNKTDLEVDDLAIRTSHPDWLINLWTAHYGKEVAEKIAISNNEEAKVSLRVNTFLTDEETLLKDSAFYKGEVDGCLYYRGNIVNSDYFKENKVIIQSESSQLAVQLLDAKENSQVLDLCAAPGSKSIQIAMMLKNTGKVVANDVYDFRVKLIQQSYQRYGLTNVETSLHDGRTINEVYPEESFDYVLLDAPCSGLGTLKHKPEIKMTITDKQLDEIVTLQKELLDSAKKMLKKGGAMVYSTCTLNKKENEKQLEKFIKENPEFTLTYQRTVFPFEFGSDGFFIARLEKH